MKNHYFYLFSVVLFMLLGSSRAMAQHAIEIAEPEKGDYATTNTTYSLSAIAEELGASIEELVAGLEQWASGGYSGNPNFFALADASGTTLSTIHSANDGGYYMDANGGLAYWANGAPWYVQLDWDDEADELYIMIGQNASIKLEVGSQYHGYVAINFNEKQVLFEMNYSIAEREAPAVEPVPFLSQIEVVGRTKFVVNEEPNNDWYRHYYTMSVAGMAEALDLEPDYLISNMRDIIYAKSFDREREAFADQLVNTLTATPTPGFWFGTGVLLEGEEEESAELQHAPYGLSDKFWVADIQYFDDDSLYFCMGQYPNAWQMGETHNAEIYYLWGNKAYVVEYILTVDVPHDDTIDGLTSLGKEEIAAERDPRKGFEADIFEIQTDELFRLLGAESILDIRVATNDEYGNLTDEYTADTTGFWFRPSGEVTTYSAGRTSFYIDYVDSLKAFAIGNMPNAFTGGEECTAVLYFIKDSKYYEYDFKLTIQQPEYTIETCEVTEMDLNVRLIPSKSGGAWEIGQTDMTPYEEVLGTANGIFYGLDASDALTKSYSVSEATNYGGGGFWMSPENEEHYAYAASYTNSDDAFGAYAVWYYRSQIHWFVCPGRRNPGEYSTGTFYIFNLWDGKALKLNTRIDFVDEIVDEVGDTEILLPARDEENTDDMAETEYDFSDMYKALGCTADQFAANGSWGVLDPDGVYVTREDAIARDLYDEIQGFPITAEGVLETGDISEAYCYVDFIEGRFVSYTADDANIDNPCLVAFIARYGSKLYKVNVVVSQSVPVAINTVATTTAQGAKMYNIAGQQLDAPQKGINIVNGKKVLIK